MRKLFALAAVAALAGLVGLAPGADAQCSTGPTPASNNVTNPVTGGNLYYDFGGTSGTIGTSGSTGHIEATGDATSQQGAIQGSTADGSTLHGRIGNGGICVNDTTVPLP